MATEWDTWQICTSVCAKPKVGISQHSLCVCPWVNVYNSVRRISRWRGKCSSLCALIRVSFGKTGAETYEMLQVAFRESCLSQSTTLSGIPTSKVDADPLKTTPAQAGLPPPTPRRPWHVCEKSFVLTNV